MRILERLIGARPSTPRVSVPQRSIGLVEERIGSGYSSDHGFLHIGKTAGSSFAALSEKLLQQGYRPPVRFGHDWTIQDIFSMFPNMRLSFIVREPLERMISGFNSRLRQGRPLNQNTWSPAEATAFSFFADPIEMLQALIGTDERLKSAAHFACKHITHVRSGYEFHFRSLELAKQYSDRFYFVGTMTDATAAMQGIMSPCGIPSETVNDLSEHVHKAATSGGELLANLSSSERAALERHFADEYAIYCWLDSLLS